MWRWEHDRRFQWLGRPFFTMHGVGQSDEHAFVTNVFMECVRDLSNSELFAYKEADRGRFDFACVLTRDYSRQLIGQTLTHHAAGIDKDLASLLHEFDRELPVYLYPHEARNEGRVQEFLHHARRPLADRVSLLRLFRYPVFDADSQGERDLVAASIRRQIRDDLLLNVLFGRLGPTDVEFLLQETGIPGLLLAALEEIAVRGFFNFPALGRALGVPPSTVRPRVFALFAAGMLEKGGGVFRVSQRGRVMLRICSLLIAPRNEGQELAGRNVGPELAFILDRLDLGASRSIPAPVSLTELIGLGFSPEDKRLRLVSEAHVAADTFGAELTGEDFLLDAPWEPPGGVVWVGR